MQLKLTTIAAGALALTLTACIPPAPEPTPAPTPAPTPTPTAAAAPQAGRQAPLPVSDPADDWHDRALTPGDWRYVQKQGETVAEYAADPLAPAPLLAIACNRAARQISITANNIALPADTLTIRTETMERTLPASSQIRGQARVVSELYARDPLLDAVVFSHGRFAVVIPRSPALVLPAWPEITRVVEDCRR